MTGLNHNLDLIIDLWPELVPVFTRQARITARIGGKSAETPLPYSTAATNAAWALTNTLTVWTRTIARTNDIDLWTDFQHATGSTAIWCATWLKTHTTQIRNHPDAPQILDEIAYAAHSILERSVDRPIETRPAGLCDCGAKLHAAINASLVTCRWCGIITDLDGRQDLLIGEARQLLATATSIARLMPDLLGRQIKADRIRQWAARHQIIARQHDETGDPMYSIGEVLDLHTDLTTRRHAG